MTSAPQHDRSAHPAVSTDTFAATSSGAQTHSLGRLQVATATLVFLLALNLRPAITCVGPLLPRLGVAVHLGEGFQGSLGALPLVCFAVVSPLVHRPARRFGAARCLVAAMLLLAAGLAARSWAGLPGLWLGTVAAGGAISVGNVLCPPMLKQVFPNHVALATGAYSACTSMAASVASAAAVPLSARMGWQGALAVWAVPAVCVALLWSGLALQPSPAPTDSRGAEPVDRRRDPVWRQATAWWLTIFMGLQATTFYVMVTWLPTIEQSLGLTAATAGNHLFWYQVLGMLAGLVIGRLMRNPDSQVVATVASSLPMAVAVVGLLMAPGQAGAWVCVAGLGSGAAFVVALSLIGLRGRGPAETTRLSGMVQSLGYLLAAGGPIVLGQVAEHTGGWHAPLLLLETLALLQLFVAVPAGRGRRPATRQDHAGTGPLESAA